jgi:hypothetical protein
LPDSSLAIPGSFPQASSLLPQDPCQALITIGFIGLSGSISTLSENQRLKNSKRRFVLIVAVGYNSKSMPQRPMNKS